jgi:hypothetical protein
MAGSELATLGSQHSDQLTGIIMYLHVVRDPTLDDAGCALMRKIQHFLLPSARSCVN